MRRGALRPLPLPAAAIASLLLLLAALAGCGSGPPAAAPGDAGAERPAAAPAPPSPAQAFEERQRERALAAARQQRPADAALAWELLLVLRPGSAEYRERLAETRRQIDAAVAERLPRAVQAAQRGEIDAAAQHYLAILALQPRNDAAADALRALERERNKRSYLGRHARTTLTRRALADAEMSTSPASRNELEHAALLAGDGEFDDAIALLERRIALDRNDAAARRLLAKVCYRKAEALLAHDRPAAIAALEKSVRFDPSEPAAAAWLAQLRRGR